MTEFYTRIYWYNKSNNLTTPLGKTNLNKMDSAIKTLDGRTVELYTETVRLNTAKADKSQLNGMVTNWQVDNKTGIVTLTKYDGTKISINTALNQLAVNFEYNSATQQLIITQTDGTKKIVDMSALITQYEFLDSDTITFEVQSDGKIKAIVRGGSIKEEHLDPDYLAEIKVEIAKAQGYAKDAQDSADNAAYDAKLSQSYAVGKSGIREGEDTDNSKAYYELIKKIYENAATITSYKVEYQASGNGTTIPDGTWEEQIPEVGKGQYLWTRTTISLSNGENLIAYNVSYFGTDGSGNGGQNFLADNEERPIVTDIDEPLAVWEQLPLLGVKGNAEKNYRDEQYINLTIDDIGLTAEDIEKALGFMPGQGGGGEADTSKEALSVVNAYGDTAGNMNTDFSLSEYTNKLTYTVVNYQGHNVQLLNLGFPTGGEGRTHRLGVQLMIDHYSDEIKLRAQESNKTYNAWCTFLNDANYSNIVRTLNYQLQPKQGIYVSKQAGINGTAGYVNFATVKILGTYANHPCVFLLSGRGRAIPIIISVCYSSANSTTPALNSFIQLGDTSYNAYIYNKGNGVWDLYAPKNEGWGQIDILNEYYDNDYFQVTHPNRLESTMSTSWIAATIGGVVGFANAVRDAGNNTTSTLAYSKAAMDYGEYTWLAGWNGYELRAVHKGQFMGEKSAYGYWGLAPGGADNVWCRTTSQGIIPYQQGNAGSGHCNLGTETWYFSKSYIDRMHGFELRNPKVGNAGSGNNRGSIIKFSSANNIYFGMYYPHDNSVTAWIELIMDFTQRSLSPIDNSLLLGTSSRRWQQVYAVNASISTSDRREKKEISYIGQGSEYVDTYMPKEQFVQFMTGLHACIFKRINGESGRPHHGFIAQDVEELMNRAGITDHAAFIKSPKTRQVEVEKEVTKDDGTTETVKITEEEVIPDEFIYGMRYEELISDNIYFTQICYEENQMLKAKVAEQQETIDKQHEVINSLLERMARLEALVLD